ncbi:MAG TPA: SDR family oxidoreductase, partial [Acidimicrobiia bacterium]|nr:SDR family oxidoreductase [Acidimicrobiia bacterium]
MSEGVGKATAVNLAHLGAKVVIVDILPEGREVASAINHTGGEAVFVQCDISDPAQLADTMSRVETEIGNVDILINNALHVSASPLVELSLDEWDKTFSTNARAPFLLIKRILPGMLARGTGTIVNMIAYEGSPLAGAYAGTKMAMRSLAYTVAREIGNESGVSVFSFVPGIVDTPLMRETLIRQSSAAFGISEEAALEIVAHNPGYEGFMPVDHCATALTFGLQRGAPYLPASRLLFCASAHIGAADDDLAELVQRRSDPTSPTCDAS